MTGARGTVTEATDGVGCGGLTDGRRSTGAIPSSSSSEIVIGEWETVVSSSSEITVVQCVLAGMTDARGAGGGTDAGGVTEETDAVCARAALGGTMAERLANADALRRSNSMKCVYEGRTEENCIFVSDNYIIIQRKI